MVGYQAADGIDILVGKVGPQRFIELLDFGQGFDAPARAMFSPLDGENIVFFFIEVVLVFDVADDLFQYILNRAVIR